MFGVVLLFVLPLSILMRDCQLPTASAAAAALKKNKWEATSFCKCGFTYCFAVHRHTDAEK
jgi:hypothetical protein